MLRPEFIRLPDGSWSVVVRVRNHVETVLEGFPSAVEAKEGYFKWLSTRT